MNNQFSDADISLDTLLRRLESIAKTLSDGSEPLESTLKQYEEGVELAKECLKRLDAAEQHVIKLRNVLESDSDETHSLSTDHFPID
ncbi:MAG: exodeoxyribonuclease VII small subunit [Bacteroidetes bacterium]|nr:exodeoxyribonuclease VII small subunit [Bacteroidota bacterium]MCY4204739.1 exodeoxyribonuclease VII small subunit [Bacteroidota bacterium]